MRISSLTSLDRSPTKMWKWPEVSSLLEVLDWYAQLTLISYTVLELSGWGDFDHIPTGEHDGRSGSAWRDQRHRGRHTRRSRS